MKLTIDYDLMLDLNCIIEPDTPVDLGTPLDHPFNNHQLIKFSIDYMDIIGKLHNATKI